MTDFRCDRALRDRLKQNLGRFEPIQIDNPDLRHAAVAIVVTGDIRNDRDPAILLTLRTARLKKHSGQYALPGGKLDSGETPLKTALRELHEELGLHLGPEDVLGQLDDYPTRSGFRITPIILWAGPQCHPVPSPGEVEKIFYIPFTELDSDAIPVLEPGLDNGPPVLCCEFPTLGHRMYSPTASIIFQFREVALRGKATRVAHFDQPKFAWA